MAEKNNRSRAKMAGHRTRAFRIRNSEVPDAVHTLMEFTHDIALELGICPTCKMRVLHRQGGRTYSRCDQCLEYNNEYNRQWRKGEK